MIYFMYAYNFIVFFIILKKYFIEIKSKIDSIITAEGLKKSNKLAIDILKSYNEV